MFAAIHQAVTLKHAARARLVAAYGKSAAATGQDARQLDHAAPGRARDSAEIVRWQN